MNILYARIDSFSKLQVSMGKCIATRPDKFVIQINDALLISGFQPSCKIVELERNIKNSVLTVWVLEIKEAYIVVADLARRIQALIRHIPEGLERGER